MTKPEPTDRRNRFSGVWAYAQARAALPYVASIMRSLREHRLDFCATASPPIDWPASPAGPGGIHCSSTTAFEVSTEISDRQVARARQAEYTKSEAAECVANVALELLTNFHVAGTMFDFPSAPRLARG